MWKTLLWLAVPLTLAAGCATAPRQTASYSDFGLLAAAPRSERETANWVITDEIRGMLLADLTIDYSLGASVDDGVVSLRGTSSKLIERQRIVDGVWELKGVTEVKDKNGVDAPATIIEKPLVAR